MKTRKKRWIALLCALCLASSTLPVQAAASGSYSDSYDIANGLRYTTASSESGGVRQQSFRLEYTPGKDVMPIVAYGSKLYGKSDINEIIDYVQQQGQSVYGAANADFFVLSTGLPSGLVVNDGRLVSSDGMWNAVGVKPDGKVIVGAPQMAMSLYSANTGDYPIYALNKQRTDAGIYLLNSDFSSETRSTGTGVTVVLTPVDDSDLKIGQDKQFTVTAVNTDVSGSTPIAEGQYILTSSNAYNNRGYTITSLQVGETVTFRANVYNESFQDVIYACGAGDMVMKDGVIQSGLSSTSDPRTLLGVRDDGSCVALVHDGRLEISEGISLREGAQLLANQGCTNVVNLDGGGSSAEAIRQPGSQETEVVNTPSDGSLRKCANYILFVNTAQKTGEESGAFVTPHSVATLKGAQITLGADTFDQHYYPVSSYSSGFRVTSPSDQAISGNVFTAPDTAGEYLISLDHPTATSIPAEITVYSEPDRVLVRSNGKDVSSLTMDPGESIDLDLDAYAESRILYETDELFQWSVTNNVGTITQSGVFTASGTSGASGEIVIRHNGWSTSIPVTVGQMPAVLDQFEGNPKYIVTSDHSAVTGTAQVTHSLDHVRYGSGALELTYTGGSSLSDSGAIVYTANVPLKCSGADSLTFFAKGDPAKALYINFSMRDGSTEQRAFNAGESWSLVTVSVPSGAVAVESFSASISKGAQGSVYIDQIYAHYNDAQPDTTPPAIAITTGEDNSLTATITDSSGFPLESSKISVQYDGEAVSFLYDDQTGTLTASLPDGSEGLHRLTIEAQDWTGNIARQSQDLGSAGTTVFEDMADHWARDYAEFLRNKNVFSTDTNFMPDTYTTNEMAATLISRYLGLDTSQYTSVELPYGDASQISDWALPHVKALYQEGIMIGTTVNGKSVFQPGNAVSRAQVMTLLGRTLVRGYDYQPASYTDMDTVPAWARDHIDLLSSLGIVNGYSGTTDIRPLSSITRGEFASLLYKLY